MPVWLTVHGYHPRLQYPYVEKALETGLWFPARVALPNPFP